MKKSLTKLVRSGVAAALVLAVSQSAFGQAVETTTTTTSSAGTITTFDPNAIVIKSETSTDPLRYQFTKKTVYVDENGQPVSVETIKSGAPVTVYYDREGNALVANKVVVRKTVTADAQPAGVESTETTTTTSEGTVSSSDPNEIVVKTQSGADPIHYRFTKTTTYVDENGQPVSIQTIQSGLPVTVYYEKQGDLMLARKVVVRNAAAPGTVIEHKKTTTTTTDKE